MNPKIVWVSIIVVLLAIPCVFYGAMLVLVQVYPVTFEPNYEQKAANWDQIRRQQQRSKQLGWKLDLQTIPSDQPYQVEVTLGITDKQGQPVTGASVEIEAFHAAHASKTVRQNMKPTEKGTYQTNLPVRYSGMWEFQVTARYKNDLFLQTLQKNINRSQFGR